MGLYFGPEARERAFKKFLCVHFTENLHYEVSLESTGLENIPQVPTNRAEVGQNHGALKAVSATPSVLKCSGALFRPTSSKLKKITVSMSLQTKAIRS